MGGDSLRPKKPLGAVLRKPQGLRNGNGEASRAVGFRVFTDDVPVLRKNETNFSELAVDAIAMVRVDADAEGFAGNELAAIDDGIKSHARDKDERGVNLFTLAVNAAATRLDPRWSAARNRRQLHVIQLLACY